MKKNSKKLKLNKKNLMVMGVVGVILIAVIIFVIIKLTGGSDTLKGYTNNKKQGEDNKTQVTPDIQIVDLKSTTRPYAVMINNLSVARPYHIGLQEAYLVYEVIVEGGITRYMAVFKDKTPEIVGPVRSSRHYYLDYALENDAYYIHWGWSPQAKNDISNLGVNNINGLTYGSPYFFRKKYANISLEHRGYASLKEISKLATSKYRKETNKDLLLNYSATNINPSAQSKNANKVNLKYSGGDSGTTTNYVYDSAANVYKQSVNNKAHTDYLTKEQYTVKNIITYQVKNYSIDSYGRQTLENTGSGEGYFITGGKAYPITWEKDERNSQTVYKYKETGEEITVNDGNTWIHIVPNSGSISITE